MCKKIIRLIFYLELMVLILMGIIYFYPPSYIIGLWLFEKSPATLWETFKSAQRTLQFKRKIEKTCSYCKYPKQQELLENLLMETDFNEFA